MCQDCMYMGATYNQFVGWLGGDFDKTVVAIRERVSEPRDVVPFCMVGLSLIAMEFERHRPPGSHVVVAQSANIPDRLKEWKPEIDLFGRCLQMAVRQDNGAATLVGDYVKTHGLSHCVGFASIVAIHYFGVLNVGVRVTEWIDMFGHGDGGFTPWSPNAG